MKCGPSSDVCGCSCRSHPATPYILKDLHEQRVTIRKHLKEALVTFADAYDQQPLRVSKYDVHPDEQKALLRQHLSLQDAMNKLRSERQGLKGDIDKLEASIAGHQAHLTACGYVLSWSRSRQAD